jgi:serine/threonine protein kinase
MRIGREVEIMKKLNHKNVVRYFDWFEDERYHCIIMELLEGTSFVNYIYQK